MFLQSLIRRPLGVEQLEFPGRLEE